MNDVRKSRRMPTGIIDAKFTHYKLDVLSLRFNTDKYFYFFFYCCSHTLVSFSSGNERNTIHHLQKMGILDINQLGEYSFPITSIDLGANNVNLFIPKNDLGQILIHFAW